MNKSILLIFSLMSYIHYSNAQYSLDFSIGSELASYEIHKGYERLYYFNDEWTKPSFMLQLGAAHQLNKELSLGLNVRYANLNKMKFAFLASVLNPNRIPRAYDFNLLGIDAELKVGLIKNLSVGLSFKNSFVLNPRHILSVEIDKSDKSASFYSIGPLISYIYKRFFIEYTFNYALNGFEMDQNDPFYDVVKKINTMSLQLGYRLKI